MARLIESDDQETAEKEPKKAVRKTGPKAPYWLRRGVLLVFIAGVIVGLVFLARWIYHLANNNQKTKQPTTSQSQAKGNSKSASSQASSQPATLPNNGPGNVIGVFAVTTFAAAALHYAISLRKLHEARRSD